MAKAGRKKLYEKGCTITFYGDKESYEIFKNIHGPGFSRAMNDLVRGDVKKYMKEKYLTKRVPKREEK